ncbi:MAG: amidohydrolase family protein [Actinomycetota bacterium]|nr:amidohydrolase family protein [Actinomycetota bacterium]
MIIDAHQHFWDPKAADYPWLTADLAPIRRAFGPGDLEPLLREHEIAGTVVVQANATLDETRQLLEIAAATPFVLGVVGWIDLTAPDVDRMLADLDGKLVGIRHQVHDEADPAWLLRDDVQRGIAAAGAAGLVFDLLVRVPQLPAAFETARRHPDVRFVVDHLGKPAVRARSTDDWSAALASLADLPNVVCKLSGLVTEADWDSWREAELEPYYRRALAWFGADRCMFGSDWPVCLLAADYGSVLALLLHAIDDLPEDERVRVLGDTAARTYGLRPPS